METFWLFMFVVELVGPQLFGDTSKDGLGKILVSFLKYGNVLVCIYYDDPGVVCDACGVAVDEPVLIQLVESLVVF